MTAEERGINKEKVFLPSNDSKPEEQEVTFGINPSYLRRRMGITERKKESMWPLARSDMFPQVKLIERYVNPYSYKDIQSCVVTDQIFCDFLLRILKEANEKIFELMNVSYEMHSDRASETLRKLRDDIEHLSERIMVRDIEDVPEKREWLKRLIKSDHDIINSTISVKDILDKSYKGLMKSFEPRVRASGNKDLWKALEDICEKLEIETDIILRTFVERERICSIEKGEMEREYKEIVEGKES